MRFHFENIGPVTSADLELGDLTLVAGRNNTGKTYIVYTMYGFLRTWPHRALVEVGPATLKRLEALLPKAHELLQGPVGSAVSFACAELERLRDGWLEDNSKSFSQQGIAEVFSSARAEFSEAVFRVEAPPTAEGAERQLRLGPYEVKVSYDDTQVSAELVDFHEVVRDSQRPPLWHQLLAGIALPDRLDPFILSAERFGISLFYKELDFTKSRLVELLQQLGNEKERDLDSPYLVVERMASRYALPVKDNIDYTRAIPNLRRGTGDLRDEKLEGEIRNLIGGYYRAAEDEIRFQSKARNRSFNIPLHLASSSARGLSDMYFYLRHTASRNQLLVIDEPESHLDTANQIALARTLARMVRSGIKVLVTTHSDYLIKEINNLVMLSQLDSGVGRRLGYGADDGLSPELVRAYVAENGSLTSCTVDEHGVDMPVFDDTIDQINRVSSELTARLVSARGERPDAA